jgi:hypothetical protein
MCEEKRNIWVYGNWLRNPNHGGEEFYVKIWQGIKHGEFLSSCEIAERILGFLYKRFAFLVSNPKLKPAGHIDDLSEYSLIGNRKFGVYIQIYMDYWEYHELTVETKFTFDKPLGIERNLGGDITERDLLDFYFHNVSESDYLKDNRELPALKQEFLYPNNKKVIKYNV